MDVIVSSKIRINNAPADIKKWAQKNLIIDNPDFYKKERMGKWTGGTPQIISLYESIGEDLLLPFGCIQKVYPLLQKHSPRYELLWGDLSHIDYLSGIAPYEYQEKAIQAALEAKNGILVMPCGSGKTQTALEIISRIGGRCLWLTHTQDLLNQSMNRAKSVYGLPADSYGKITAGKVNIGSAITFATIQTLSKADMSSFSNYWDIIIVDECQHCCGSPTRVTQFYKALSQLSARYKIGLTATPKRSDGLQKSMFALLGDIIYEVSRDDVKNTTCDVEVRTIETGWMPDYDCVLMGDGTINYAALVSNLVEDQERFKFVLQEIEKLPPNEPIIVLANRVELLKRLNREYFGRSQCLSAMGNSKSAKAERKRALSALNAGDIDCLFATYQLAKEGLDVPNLRYVVFATPEKDETTIIQSVGRVSRKASGKTIGTVIDFLDDFGMYRGWYKKRCGYYKKIDVTY